jgi:hypothetical protein
MNRLNRQMMIVAYEQEQQTKPTLEIRLTTTSTTSTTSTSTASTSNNFNEMARGWIWT